VFVRRPLLPGRPVVLQLAVPGRRFASVCQTGRRPAMGKARCGTGAAGRAWASARSALPSWRSGSACLASRRWPGNSSACRCSAPEPVAT